MPNQIKKLETIFYGATFDDFLLRPQHSIVSTRREIDLTMPFTKGISINMPIVGANMDTVTREKMMNTLSLEGCFGFIDRNCSIEDEATRVKYVKTQHSFVIENPIVLYKKATIGEAKIIIKKKGVSGILLEDEPGTKILAGILSHRDVLRNNENDGRLVEEFMTPFKELVTAKPGISIGEAEKVMFRNRIEKLPLIDKKRRIKGLITMKDLRLAKQKPYSNKDKKGRLLAGAAIGASGDFMERTEALLKAGVDCLLMDVAHADSDVIKKAFKNFKSKFKDVPIACGNIATGEGARFLMDLGVDAIKVGVGPGRGCRTRLEVGAGIPQMQAIREAYLATNGKIPIIADGGIKNDKDIFMAIAAGASTVMLGSMLSGTDESPGFITDDPVTKQRVKIYRGMTSPEAVADNSTSDNLEEALSTPQEGQSVKVPYVGSVVGVISRISGHLRSAVSYAGEKTLYDAHKKIAQNPEDFLIRLSVASQKESFDR